MQFEEKLQNVMKGFYELFELSKEHNLEPINDSGTIVYSEDSGKHCLVGFFINVHIAGLVGLKPRPT